MTCLTGMGTPQIDSAESVFSHLILTEPRRANNENLKCDQHLAQEFVFDENSCE